MTDTPKPQLIIDALVENLLALQVLQPDIKTVKAVNRNYICASEEMPAILIRKGNTKATLNNIQNTDWSLSVYIDVVTADNLVEAIESDTIAEYYSGLVYNSLMADRQLSGLGEGLAFDLLPYGVDYEADSGSENVTLQRNIYGIKYRTKQNDIFN